MLVFPSVPTFVSSDNNVTIPPLTLTVANGYVDELISTSEPLTTTRPYHTPSYIYFLKDTASNNNIHSIVASSSTMKYVSSHEIIAELMANRYCNIVSTPVSNLDNLKFSPPNIMTILDFTTRNHSDVDYWQSNLRNANINIGESVSIP